MLKDIMLWKNSTHLRSDYAAELAAMNDAELQDAFATDLAFGTGGLREKMGAGTNRLNLYTIRRTTLGVARAIKAQFPGRPLKAVVAYDTRRDSRIFAEETARTLASEGFHCYLFSEVRPTPELSFAVRHLHCDAGVIITASHNPPIYNGYKVYNAHGGQAVPAEAEPISRAIEQVTDYLSYEPLSLDYLIKQKKISVIDREVDEAYFEVVRTVRCRKVDPAGIRFVFTPLHGTAYVFGADLLKGQGFDVTPVPEQMVPDGQFSTVVSPNPENPKAFLKAAALGREIKADVLLATAPDADRMGVGVWDGKDYVFLTGNQTGALILDYLCHARHDLQNGVMVSTIVTSDLGVAIAKHHHLAVVQTLTGFKFIGEQIALMEGTDRHYFFGYEESYGCLLSPEVRDKDAFQALTILCEMACYFQQKGWTLLDAFRDVLARYGDYRESLINLELGGAHGQAQIAAIMDRLRRNPPHDIGGYPVLRVEDYETGVANEQGVITPLDLPLSNVLRFHLPVGWVVFRPSGTEPKLKAYLAVHEATAEASAQAMARLFASVDTLLKEDPS